VMCLCVCFVCRRETKHQIYYEGKGKTKRKSKEKRETE
jgi:hypothetical protein